jgi:hypothetical protein
MVGGRGLSGRDGVGVGDSPRVPMCGDETGGFLGVFEGVLKITFAVVLM